MPRRRLPFANLFLILALFVGDPLFHMARGEAAAIESTALPAALHVVVINGGGSAAQNYQSHVLHLRQLLALLVAAGVPSDHITIFASDGADPAPDLTVRERALAGDFSLLEGTRLEQRFGPPRTQVNTTLAGFAPRPATRAALREWFTQARKDLHGGDQLLLYVTDHGTGDNKDHLENRITLWGKDESLSVRELGELVAKLPRGVRVVTLMSQCFSGGFARLALPDQASSGEGWCGYFSSTEDRQAYGCYAEDRERENVGHSFEFLGALGSTGAFARAHAATLVADQTPDVPLRTSDVFLDDLLRRTAGASKSAMDRLVEELLQTAWNDRGAWEPEIRLLDALGQAFGWFSPRSLAELDGLDAELPNVLQHLKGYAKAWKDALGDLRTANLDRFLAEHPDWAKRLDPATPLPAGGAGALRDELVRELAAFTRADAATTERLAVLREKSEDSAALRHRMEVRQAALLRMRWLLENVAGRVLLASPGGAEEERTRFAALQSCEDFRLPGLPLAPASRPDAPFPSYADDLKLAERTLPSWMGIKFRTTDTKLRSDLRLAPGAVDVEAVYEGSPAETAGLHPGDLVVGTPEHKFARKNEIREWIMLQPVGEPRSLVFRRNEEWQTASIVPVPYPLHWPTLKGPPKLESAAPALHLTAYRGDLPPEGAPHLLYFWATWCFPCKAALPEILAFERDRSIPVIAITDESSAQLDGFFAKHPQPFPSVIARDPERRTSLDYGVSGTPTFVFVDGHGEVQSVHTGYSPAVGLGVPGWKYRARVEGRP